MNNATPITSMEREKTRTRLTKNAKISSRTSVETGHAQSEIFNVIPTSVDLGTFNSESRQGGISASSGNKQQVEIKQRMKSAGIVAGRHRDAQLLARRLGGTTSVRILRQWQVDWLDDHKKTAAALENDGATEAGVWRRDYNEVSPHSDIGNMVPISLVSCSGAAHPP